MDGSRELSWLKTNYFHRSEDQPSFVCFDKNNVLREEFWAGSTGCGERLSGPARILYDKNGKVTDKQYFLGGFDSIAYNEWKSDVRVIEYYRGLRNNNTGCLITDVSF